MNVCKFTVGSITLQWSAAVPRRCTRLQVDFGATPQYIDRYRAIFRAALDGEAPPMLLDARDV